MGYGAFSSQLSLQEVRARAHSAFGLDKGSDFASSLPERLSDEREQRIVDAVRLGNYVVNWVPLPVTAGDLAATFWISNDALRIGTEADSFRPAVKAKTQQKIADELNAVMPTAKLSDDTYRQAHIRLKPVTLGTHNMTGTSRMIRHHNDVERQLTDKAAGLSLKDSIIAPVGKDWIMSRRLLGGPTVNNQPAAINYGWHGGGGSRSVTSPPIRLWQSPGMGHSYEHQDYSQVVRLVSRLVSVCMPASLSLSSFGAFVPGKSAPGVCQEGLSCPLPEGGEGTVRCMDIYDLAQDPELWPLLSHNGPVYMRHFAVPYQAPSGDHSLWGGFPAAPPPPNQLTGGTGGNYPALPVLLPGAGGIVTPGRLLAFGAAAVAGWFAVDKLRKRR